MGYVLIGSELPGRAGCYGRRVDTSSVTGMPVRIFAWVLVVLGGLTAVSSILASVFGAQAILLAVGSAIFTGAALLWASKLQAEENRSWRDELLRREQQKALERQQHQEELERQQELRRQRSIREGLDRDCADLLRRAEGAVKVIVASDARAEDLLDPPVDEELLRENVEAVLTACIKITDLRAKQREIIARSSPRSEEPRLGDLLDSFFGGRSRTNPSEDPLGPETAAVLRPQQQALAMVLRSVTSRVENLEHYASSVKAVDATNRDFNGAQQAERLNESVRDLLANTVRDELAAEELKRLTERTAAAEQAFRDSIHEANLAAETLALPDDKGP